MNGQTETVTPTRLGEKLLGAGGIILFRRQIGRTTEESLGEKLAGGDRHAFHDPLDDGLAVDHHGNRLANPRVLERILVHRLAVLGGHER